MSAAPAEQVAVLSRMKRSGSLEIKVRYDLRYGCYGHQCGWGRISKFAELSYRLKREGGVPLVGDSASIQGDGDVRPRDPRRGGCPDPGRGGGVAQAFGRAQRAIFGCDLSVVHATRPGRLL